MGISKIEWLRSPDGKPGYTINPVKGLCPMSCPYCYARRMYKRFGWDETIKFEPLDYIRFPSGSKVFVGSTMELFGSWVKDTWLDQIFEWCRRLPTVTFIFLTKQPQNLAKWSPFPDNCWIGCSATNSEHAVRAMTELDFIDAKMKFLSIEPLLNNDGYTKWGYISFKKINWLIIGQQTPTSPKTMPHIHDIQAIIQGANNAGVSVFLKNNLEGFLPFQQYFKTNDNWKEVYGLRQELPQPEGMKQEEV